MRVRFLTPTHEQREVLTSDLLAEPHTPTRFPARRQYGKQQMVVRVPRSFSTGAPSFSECSRPGADSQRLVHGFVLRFENHGPEPVPPRPPARSHPAGRLEHRGPAVPLRGGADAGGSAPGARAAVVEMSA